MKSVMMRKRGGTKKSHFYIAEVPYAPFFADTRDDGPTVGFALRDTTSRAVPRWGATATLSSSGFLR
jgi:hypothetical protein